MHGNARCCSISSDPMPVESLNVFDNDISGSLPSTIGRLTALQMLDYSDNFVNSTIPETIGNLTALTNYTASLNFHSGPLPTSIQGMLSLQHLKLDENELTGALPTEIGLLFNTSTSRTRPDHGITVIRFDVIHHSLIFFSSLFSLDELGRKQLQLVFAIRSWFLVVPRGSRHHRQPVHRSDSHRLLAACFSQESHREHELLHRDSDIPQPNA